MMKHSIDVVVVILLVGMTSTVVGHSYTCSLPCEREACPTINCKGAFLDDNCGCCKICAKQVNETCGGLAGLYGYCDEDLYCLMPPPSAAGDYITEMDQVGTCKRGLDYFASFCDGFYTGCNIENVECICATNVKACTNPFKYTDKKHCRRALSRSRMQVSRLPDCSKVQCEPVLVPPCPEDSRLFVGFSPPGECCPEAPECVCDPSMCYEIMCADGYEKEITDKGTGEPGRCCDIFECKDVASLVDCSSVICADLMPILCPVDSVLASGGISGDGCCLLPERCECVKEICQPPICDPGFEARRIVRGTGVPGSCCDIHECVNKTTREWCLYEDEIYEDGAHWQTESCQLCRCRGGVSHCLLQKDCKKEDDVASISPLCLDKTFYAHDETWNRDECTRCRCRHGEVQCTAHSCSVSCINPIKLPGQCCPYCDEPTFITFPAPTACPPLPCTLQCQHGYSNDHNGCPLCSCQGAECDDMRDCDKHCPDGLKIDRNGCEVCRCKHTRQCPPIDCGNKHCTYGFQKNKHGCNKCKCEKCAVFECDKQCTFGFVTNDNGCKLCKCKVAATTAPVVVIPIGSCDIHDNGEIWHDGCRSCYCHNGQEMCALISCPVPECQNPVLRSDDCCPACTDDESSGQPMFSHVCHSSGGEYYVEGETWYIDSCTQCVCHDGHVLCSPLTCPPTPCNNPVMKSDTCCPYCQESDMTTVDDIFLISCTGVIGVKHYDGDAWKEDDCTSCMCRHGEITCYSHVCPSVQCKTPILKKGQCCPSCLDPSNQKYCEFENQIYTEGERWNIDTCIHCHCQDAIGVCTIPECPELVCENQHFLHIGDCCPSCMDENTDNTKVQTTLIPKGRGTSTVPITSPTTSRSTFKIYPEQPDKTDSHHYPTTQGLDTTTEKNGGQTRSAQGFPILPVVLPIILLTLVISLVVLILVCLRQRQWKSSFHSAKIPISAAPCKTKNVDMKNSNSIYNGAATKSCNVYEDSCKLKCQTDRYSGLYSMGNVTNAQQV